MIVRHVGVAVWLAGLAVYTAYRLGKQHAEEQAARERYDRDAREELNLRFAHVGQALQDLHGRIDAERWLATGVVPGQGGPPPGMAQA